MKKLFLISLLAFSFNSSFSQIPEKVYSRALDSVLSDYFSGRGKIRDKKMIQDGLLDERLSKAFNHVVFANSDLVDNAAAFGYTRNEEKTTISVNTNFHLKGNSRYQTFLKIGINGSGSGSVFPLYENESWKNSIGGNLGLIYKFKGSGGTVHSTNEVEKNNFMRKKYLDSLKPHILEIVTMEYHDVVDSYVSKIGNSKTTKKEIDSLHNYLVKFETIYTILSKEVVQKKIEECRDNKDCREKYKNAVKPRANKKKSMRSVLKDSIYPNFLDYKYETKDFKKVAAFQKMLKTNKYELLEHLLKYYASNFDDKTIKNTGYTFHWLDINLSLNNDTFNFSEAAQNVEASILEAFNTLEKADRVGINRLRTKLSLAYNYIRESKSKLLYFKVGLDYNSGSFLRSNLISETPKVNAIDDTNREFILTIEDKNDKIVPIGNSSAIKENFQYGSLNIYGAGFFFYKKTLGINLSASHNYTIENVPLTTSYESNYSLLAGILFRKLKDDGSTNLTFGLDFGYDNTPYTSKAEEYFVAKLKVGVPFNIFNLKPTKK